MSQWKWADVVWDSEEEVESLTEDAGAGGAGMAGVTTSANIAKVPVPLGKPLKRQPPPPPMTPAPGPKGVHPTVLDFLHGNWKQGKK